MVRGAINQFQPLLPNLLLKQSPESVTHNPIMKKLLYYVQDSRRIRVLAVALSKRFEVSIAGDLLELAAIMKEHKPAILLIGFASHDRAFNAYHLECVHRSILSAKIGNQERSPPLSVFIILESEMHALMPGNSRLKALQSLPFCEVHVIYLPLPIERISSIIFSAVEENLDSSCAERAEIQSFTCLFADECSPIIGKSKNFRRMISQIRSYADEQRPVLIIGETGTGKELAAHSLHSWSKRKLNSFVALNCAAIPETLFESEMFGTERGAYTDACSRCGALEQADNGTLFLDEIGSLSAASQPSLLRVLETGEYRRLGSTHSHSAQFRLVSASCLNPIDLAAENRFRNDLLFRIADFVIEIPPLRERKEDIPLLARHFCTQFSKDIYDIEDGALDKLAVHDWPGNIRELQSVIARACARKTAGEIGADDIEFLTGISRLAPHKS